MEYAVIQIGSKQYIVEKGAVIEIDKRAEDVGASVTFTEVPLYVKDEQVVLGRPFSNYTVEAKIVDHVRQEKKSGIRYQSGGYRKKFGHKQQMTRVEITNFIATK